MQRVWQIAAGESGRYYDDLFLKHDVMFLGPGGYGRYEKDKYDKVVKGGLFTANKIGQIRSFAFNVKPNDIVLLRRGYDVIAVGLIPEGSNYDWSKTFDDVYGWDLQHFRRVIWQDELKSVLTKLQKGAPLFGERKQIPTFTAVKDEKVLSRIASLLDNLKTRDLKVLPDDPPEPMNWEQLAEALFSKGIASSAVDNVVAAVKHQQQLGKWYAEIPLKEKRPSEHEVVAHLILPLMKALGWSEQLLAVEWHKIDLAAFYGAPTTASKCVLLCEAKGLGHGLQNVIVQATNYVKNNELTNCNRLMLTDGRRIYLHERDRGPWNAFPSGYLNVDKIREGHLAPRDTNAIDTLIALTPAGVTREIGE